MSKVLLFQQGGNGVEENTYYGVKNGKIVERAEYSKNYNAGIETCTLNGKKVSKTKIDNYRRKLAKEPSLTLEYDGATYCRGFWKNTEANIKKYCR